MDTSFRFIHTSDWHLGQSFMGKSREAEHQAFAQWLVQQVREHDIDAVIVAGDIFDTGAPPSYARTLYNRIAETLSAENCQLILLAGNHDSAAVLAENKSLLKRLNVHVIPMVAEDPEELVIPLRNKAGEVAALLCALPFIRPRDLVRLGDGVGHQDIQAELMQQIQQYYHVVYQAARAQNAEVPIIGTGHLTTFDAQLSESVREIYVGTLQHFPADAFPPFDYLALGHIHRAQTVGGLEHYRYSGSPIALSFDELGREKQVLQVSFNAHHQAQITPIQVPVFQPMQVLKGNLEAIKKSINALPATGKPVWVEVQVEEQDYLSDLHQRIEAMLEDKPIEVLRIRRMHLSPTQGATQQAQETLEELQHQEVFERRLQEAEVPSEQQAQLTALYEQVVSEMEEQA